MATKTKEKMDVYQIVTNRIIEKLEQGVAPWKKPWSGMGGPVNWKTMRAYRGINALVLEPGEYASKKQILEAGGRIIKDEYSKGHMVVYWHWTKYKADGQEDVADEDATWIKRAKPFYSTVWEINKQCIGLESKMDKIEALDFNPVEKAEEMLDGFFDVPPIQTSGSRAYYVPALDYINMPPKEDFHSEDEYYSTLFHEIVHSTGHATRLNREGIARGGSFFGSTTYTKEELVAEMGAAMLCSMAGIDDSTIDNSAAYIDGWLQNLKNDKKFLFSAASQAQKAVDRLTGTMFLEETEAEEEEAVIAS